MKEIDILFELRKWLKVPFKHQGRSMYGCDCVGLIVGALDNLGYTINNRPISYYDHIDYSRIPTEGLLESRLRNLFSLKIPAHGDTYKEQDIDICNLVLFRMGRHPQHVGITTNYPNGIGLIHSYASAGNVVEHRFSQDWLRRVLRVYKVIF